ncbi:hypothetical protein ACQ4PT_024239 [Festuca glaucescens]
MVVVRGLGVADERLVVGEVAAGELAAAGGEHEVARPREGDARAMRLVTTNLADIEYRSSAGEMDIRRHVFRWDNSPYEFVFENCFEARRQRGTPDSTFYNLERYVNSGGRPLDSRRETTHAFVSTTLSSSWHPSVDPGTTCRVYRYEIYAPGGIIVAETLCDLYNYPAQDEIAFPAGIAPQYIRSAQLFELTNDRRYTNRRRVDDVLYINRHFNPQSHPQVRRINIQRPVCDCYENNARRRLAFREFPADQQQQQKKMWRSVNTNNDDLTEYYKEGVTRNEYYIDSAFRSIQENEAYMFIQGEYVLINYAPGTTNDKIIKGPMFIGDGFPSLVGTNFAEYGIDAAFGCHNKNEAIIFSGNLCARIDYAPGPTDGSSIKEGPKTIKQMFPFFKGTKFEKGIDAAFESSNNGEAFLFKGSEYARINYDGKTPSLVAIHCITTGFKCLQGTEFASDIGAAFASHRTKEAYLFKGDSYILLQFTPGENNDKIKVGPKKIVPSNWPSLKDFVPRKNSGMDVYEYSRQPPDPPHRDHDEL